MAKPKSSNEGSGGQLVSTFYYEYKGIVEPADDHDDDDEAPAKKRPPVVASKKVAIELRLIKMYEGDTPPLAVKSLTFRLTCKAMKLSLWGSDIEALRCAMWDKLDRRYATAWEDFFLVEISGVGIYEGSGAGLQFSYKRVEKGIAWDGTWLLREYTRYDGESIKPWPGEFIDKRGTVIACIRGTKANKKALEQFSKKVDALRELLAEYVRPETIMKTLTAGMKLLAIPDDPGSSEIKGQPVIEIKADQD